MRNLTLIKCTPGHRMPTFQGSRVSFQGSNVYGTGAAHGALIIARKRFVTELQAARVLVQTTDDLPSIVSAPPRERRP